MYNAISNDIIYDVDVIPSTGADEMTANGASIQNKGLEFNINYKVVDKNNFKWNSKFIYAANKNTVLEMNGITGEMAKTMNPSLVPSRGIAKFSEVSPGHEYAEFKVLSWARFGHGLVVDHDLDINTPDVNIDSLSSYDWEKMMFILQKMVYQLCILKRSGLVTPQTLIGLEVSIMNGILVKKFKCRAC